MNASRRALLALVPAAMLTACGASSLSTASGGRVAGTTTAPTAAAATSAPAASSGGAAVPPSTGTAAATPADAGSASAAATPADAGSASTAPTAGGSGATSFPVVATPKLPAQPSPAKSSPGDDDDTMTRLAYDLELTTVKTAGVQMPTSTTCSPAIDDNKSGTSVCTVTYAGVQVPYTIDYKGGPTIFNYSVDVTKGVLLRSVVLASAANVGYFSNELNPFCVNLPEVSVVDLDEPSGATCKYHLKSSPKTVNTENVVLSEDDGPSFVAK